MPFVYAAGVEARSGRGPAGGGFIPTSRGWGLALIVRVIVPTHGERGVAEHRVLVREEGRRGAEMFEDFADVVTAETLRRHDEEIEAGVHGVSSHG